LSTKKNNEEILESVDEKLRRHKSNRLRRVTRMDSNVIPKLMQNYRPHEEGI